MRAAFAAGVSGYLVWQFNKVIDTEKLDVLPGTGDPLFGRMRAVADDLHGRAVAGGSGASTTAATPTQSSRTGAATAMASATAASAPAPAPVLAPGPGAVVLDDASGPVPGASLTYGGDWASGTSVAKWDGSDHYSDQPGASATLIFNGTGLDLVAARAPHHGLLGVTVDGGPERTIDLYGATRRDRVVEHVTHGLPDAVHTAVFRVTGTSRPAASGHVVALDRFDILRAP